MPINYLPNDPGAAANAPLKAIAPMANRLAGRCTFAVSGLTPENRYPPGSTEFLGWQIREACLRALDSFEAVSTPLAGWAAGGMVLTVTPDAGTDLNAHYSRTGLSFFRPVVAGRTVESGASAEVASHEAGHAMLDSIRPDLWDVPYLEVDALHEGFGDCCALAVALTDVDARTRLLSQTPDLRQPNFIEAMGEELSWAIAQRRPGHNASAPRRANNVHRWQPLNDLPTDGPPAQLIREGHSLGQLVSGIMYDILAGLFALSNGSEAALLSASRRSLALVIDAARTAPVSPRMLKSWAQMLLAADARQNGGANRGLITAILSNRNLLDPAFGLAPPVVPLNSRALLATGPVSRWLATSARSKVRDMLALEAGQKFSYRTIGIDDAPMLEISGTRWVELSGLSERLLDVLVAAPAAALIGTFEGRSAVMNSIDRSESTDAEARDYVSRLVEKDAIAFADEPGAMAVVDADGAKTHRVVSRGPIRVLERISYQCRCPHS